jgi:hypothetical protein
VPAPSHPIVVAADPCDPAPVYQPAPPVWQAPAPQPVWQAPFFTITNTRIAKSGATYIGSIGTSKIKSVPHLNMRAAREAYGFAPKAKAKPTQAWFDLTEATRIDNGREFFTIGTTKGLFNTLQLQALGSGSNGITQVLVEYADSRGKTSQVFKLNQLINRTKSTITLDLDGEYRSIKRIVVYGTTDKGSAFKIQAM